MTLLQRAEAVPEWFSTPHLRFVERPKPDEFTSMVSTTMKVRILQQLWQHGETGRTQWRDVPLCKEESV